MAKDAAKSLKDEIVSLKTQLVRALADYDNLQKREEKDKELVSKRASLRLLSEILPLLDLVKKAQANLSDPALQLVEQSFEELLKKEGLEKIDSNGVEFDPNIHEVIQVVSGEQENKVAEVLASGYKYGDWVLRPAQVKVYSKNDQS